MALEVKASNVWTPALHGHPIRDVHEAIAKINGENYVGHFGKPTKIAKTSLWRIDLETSAVEESNVQVQRNDVREAPSTVAIALVSHRYNKRLGGSASPGYAARFTELTNAIQLALNRSLRTHRVGHPTKPGSPGSFVQQFIVVGDFSAPQIPIE